MSARVFRINWTVLMAVLKICLMLCLGVHLHFRKLLTGDRRKCLSALSQEICLPCLLFAHALPQGSLLLIKEGWPLLLWPFAYTILSAVLLLCLAPLAIPRSQWGIASACAAFPTVYGIPIAVISALGSAVPNSPSGFSPLVFLTVIQFSDSLLKYSVAPVIFRLSDETKGLEHSPASNGALRALLGVVELLKTVFTPQVVAVLVAVGISSFLPDIKAQMLPQATGQPVGVLALTFAAASQLGECAIPLCLLSVGGRIGEMLVEYSGAAEEADSRSKLLQCAALIGAVRIVLAPLVLFGAAYAYKTLVLMPQHVVKPTAFWAPALVCAAMPTANNLSMMADLAGNGRSLTNATTALQLMAAPLVLVLTLTTLLTLAWKNPGDVA